MKMWNGMDPVPGSVGEPGSALDRARVGPDEYSDVLEPEAADDGGACAGPIALRQALHELGEIHRAEQALLLSEAAELWLAKVQCAADRFPMFGAVPAARSEASWRRALHDERCFARADGVPFAPLLEAQFRRVEAIGRSQPEAGTSGLDGSGARDLERAVRLASAAVALEPWPESRLTLARALTAYGAERAAARELAALEDLPGVDWNSPAARVLRTAIIGYQAASAAWRGDTERALDLFLQQLERSGDFQVAASTVALALTLGDRTAFERGTHALGILQRTSRTGTPPGWERTVACLRSLARPDRSGWRLPKSAMADLLKGVDPWSAKIATLVLADR